MKTRIISGAVLFGILISTLLVGSYYLFFFCLIASLIGMFELFKVFNLQKKPLAIISYISAIAIYITVINGITIKYELLILITTLIVMLAFFVFQYPKIETNELFVSYFAYFYVAIMLSFVLRIRMLPHGNILVWLIFIGSWLNDTAAYFTGYFFGKYKMAPVLSPKKTIEGAIGGIAISTLVGFIYGLIAAKTGILLKGNIVLTFTIAGLFGSICGIIGDLAASAIKRKNDVKDYGKLIPGHGGILDRFDSVILVAPVVYFSILLIGFK